MQLTTDRSTLKNERRTRFYAALLGVRPAQLGALLKKALRVERQYISTLGGHTFWADPVSVFGLQLLRAGIYEPWLTRLVHQLLRPSDTFVDVGANEGYFSILASSLVAPDGLVHCIEPQARLRSVLEENIRVNAAHRVIVHPRAFSDKNEEVKLFLRPSTNSGASSMFHYWKVGSVFENVRAVSMETFFREQALGRVRLVKIDCEGAESLVIAGSREVLDRKVIDFVALDYHPQICGLAKCLSTHDTLRSAGYMLTKGGGLYLYHLPGLERDLGDLPGLRVDCSWDA